MHDGPDLLRSRRQRVNGIAALARLGGRTFGALRGIGDAPADGADRRRHLLRRAGDGLDAGAGLARCAGNRIGLGGGFIGGLRQGFRVAFQPHGRRCDTADDIGDQTVEMPDFLVEISGTFGLTLRFLQFMLGQALPLDPRRLEDFERAGELADFIGAAESRDRGAVLLVGDLTHRVHHGGQRPHDAIADGKIGDEANRGGNDRNGNACHQKI